jgi:putative ABC transport system permease protein
MIAMPIMWIIGNSWINNFAFRMRMTAEVFIVPLLAFTIIAIGTVSLQVFRGASANPAKVLRSEG